MRFTLERVAEPDIEPVTLVEMRKHLRCIDGVTDDDDYIATLIAVAREWVEDYTSRALIDQSWCLSVEHEAFIPTGAAVGAMPRIGQWIRPGEIQLRRGPAIAITSFVIVDAAGVETEIDPATYEIRGAKSKWPRVVALNGATWATGSFRITFRAGFAERIGSPQFGGEVVPAVFKHAIKLVASNFYENREPVVIGTITSELPLDVKWLLNSQRASLSIA
jgi:uncharacterized phiE125 gp8 family phage protein